MKKLKMTTQKLTFSEGCNKYLEYCRQRNLRQGTINHYKQSYTERFDNNLPFLHERGLSATLQNAGDQGR